jgi:hypothetical protein
VSKGQKLFRILASLAAVGMAIALTAFLPYYLSPREPSYNGHPLSYWVAVLDKQPAAGTGPNIEGEEATNAIVHIGAAATPFLVKWFKFDHPKWKRRLASGLDRIPFAPAKRLADRVYNPTLANKRANSLANGSRFAFAVLGPRAMPAFDDLCHLMNDTNTPVTTIRVAEALACLGTNSLPPLLAAVTNANHPAHQPLLLLNFIVRMPFYRERQAAQQLAPVFANCVNPTNDSAYQIFLITQLESLDAASETSVPALASCLTSTNSTVRRFSAAALGSFLEQATAAIPALTNAAFSDPDSQVRSRASNALNHIDPVSFPPPYGTWTERFTGIDHRRPVPPPAPVRR